MFLDPENIGIVGIMSLSAIISEMSINTSLCVGHLGIQYVAITATSSESYGIS